VGTDGARVGVAYSATRYHLQKEFSSLDASGTGETYTINGSLPFLRTRRVTVQGLGAYETRRFEDRIGQTGIVTARGVRGASLGVSGESRDIKAGGEYSTATVMLNYGQAHIDSPGAAAIDAAGPRVQGNYAKWTANGLRIQPIVEKAWVHFIFNGQKASKNL